MSFWEDLSPNVKRYVIVGVVVLLALLAVRACIGPESESEPPPRGVQR